VRSQLKLIAWGCAAGLAILAGSLLRAPALFEILTLNLKYNLLDQLSERQDKQLEYLLRYKELARATLGETHYYTRNAYLSLGRLYRETGSYDESLNEYEQVLQLVRKPDDELNVLSRIGQVHLARRDYAKSVEHHLKSLEKNHGLRDNASTAEIREGLSTSLMLSGRSNEASKLSIDRHAERQLEGGKTGPMRTPLDRRASDLRAAASRALMAQKFEDAVKFGKEAIQALVRVNGQGSPRVAEARVVLAGYYLALNRTDEAEREIVKAIDIQRKNLVEDHLALADSHTFYGFVHENQKRPDKAIEEYISALRIQRRRLPDGSAAIGETSFFLGRAYQRVHNWQAAYDHLAEAVKIFSEGDSFGGGRRIQTSFQLQSYNQLLLVAAELQAKAARDSETLADSTLRAAQASTHSSAEEAIRLMSARLQTGDPRLAESARQLQEISRQYEVLVESLLSTGQLASKETYRSQDADNLKNLRARKDELTAQLSTAFPAYFRFVDPTPMKLEEIRDNLTADETLVAFFFANGTTYVWVIARSAPALWVDLKISAAELDKHVARLREALEDDLSAYKPPGKRFSFNEAFLLYKLLFLPVESALRTKRLLIVPTGSLATIPLHVLVTRAPPTGADNSPGYSPVFYRTAAWLALEKSLVTLPAVQSLKALRADSFKPSTAAQNYIGFGDPDTSALPDAKPLKNASAEIRAAASAYGAPGSSIRLGADASESAAKSLPLFNYRTLHFATHAITSASTQALNGEAEPALVLTKAGSDDGLLTAGEVATLRLNADWVILSACDTASEGQAGGPLSGLARAFFYAGARSVLVSHWKISDKATSELIIKVIDQFALDPSGSISDHLQKAMRFLIMDTTHDQFAYPTFWAPFVVVGSRLPDG
jgi:CHAT domain-containing protein